MSYWEPELEMKPTMGIGQPVVPAATDREYKGEPDLDLGRILDSNMYRFKAMDRNLDAGNTVPKPDMPSDLLIALVMASSGRKELTIFGIIEQAQKLFIYFKDQTKDSVRDYLRRSPFWRNGRGTNYLITQVTFVRPHKFSIKERMFAHQLKVWKEANPQRDTSLWMKEPDDFEKLLVMLATKFGDGQELQPAPKILAKESQEDNKENDGKTSRQNRTLHKLTYEKPTLPAHLIVGLISLVHADGDFLFVCDFYNQMTKHFPAYRDINPNLAKKGLQESLNRYLKTGNSFLIKRRRGHKVEWKVQRNKFLREIENWWQENKSYEDSWDRWTEQPGQLKALIEIVIGRKLVASGERPTNSADQLEGEIDENENNEEPPFEPNLSWFYIAGICCILLGNDRYYTVNELFKKLVTVFPFYAKVDNQEICKKSMAWALTRTKKNSYVATILKKSKTSVNPAWRVKKEMFLARFRKYVVSERQKLEDWKNWLEVDVETFMEELFGRKWEDIPANAVVPEKDETDEEEEDEENENLTDFTPNTSAISEQNTSAQANKSRRQYSVKDVPAVPFDLAVHLVILNSHNKRMFDRDIKASIQSIFPYYASYRIVLERNIRRTLNNSKQKRVGQLLFCGPLNRVMNKYYVLDEETEIKRMKKFMKEWEDSGRSDKLLGLRNGNELKQLLNKEYKVKETDFEMYGREAIRADKMCDQEDDSQELMSKSYREITLSPDTSTPNIAPSAEDHSNQATIKNIISHDCNTESPSESQTSVKATPALLNTNQHAELHQSASNPDEACPQAQQNSQHKQQPISAVQPHPVRGALPVPAASSIVKAPIVKLPQPGSAKDSPPAEPVPVTAPPPQSTVNRFPFGLKYDYREFLTEDKPSLADLLPEIIASGNIPTANSTDEYRELYPAFIKHPNILKDHNWTGGYGPKPLPKRRFDSESEDDREKKRKNTDSERSKKDGHRSRKKRDKKSVSSDSEDSYHRKRSRSHDRKNRGHRRSRSSSRDSNRYSRHSHSRSHGHKRRFQHSPSFSHNHQQFPKMMGMDSIQPFFHNGQWYQVINGILNKMALIPQNAYNIIQTGDQVIKQNMEVTEIDEISENQRPIHIPMDQTAVQPKVLQQNIQNQQVLVREHLESQGRVESSLACGSAVYQRGPEVPQHQIIGTAPPAPQRNFQFVSVKPELDDNDIEVLEVIVPVAKNQLMQTIDASKSVQKTTPVQILNPEAEQGTLRAEDLLEQENEMEVFQEVETIEEGRSGNSSIIEVPRKEIIQDYIEEITIQSYDQNAEKNSVNP